MPNGYFNGAVPKWLQGIKFLLGVIVALIIEGLWLAGIVAAKLGHIESLSVLEWGLGLAVTVWVVRGIPLDVITCGAGDTEKKGR